MEIKKDCSYVAMDTCFWCGESKGILLDTRLKNSFCTKEIITGYEPCDECKKQREMGITIIEVQELSNTENQLEIQEGLYPTGRFLVVKEDFIGRLIDDKDLVSDVILKRILFIDEGTFNMIMPKE